MSTINSKNVQVGTSNVAAENFTLYQPAIPDGTVRLGVGNSGATTADVVTVNSAGMTVTGSLSATTLSISTVPHTITVYTSGSGTYTTPANCKAILVELIGAGGGAGGNNSGYNAAGATGTAGGNTTFGSLTGGGGPGGTVSAIPPAGGTATGGDVNITGGRGGSSV